MRLRRATIVKLVVAACFGLVLLWQAYGFRVMLVQTASMEPSIHKGDIILTRGTSVYRTSIGDVVSYRHPVQQSMIVTHRVVSIDPIRGILTTRGDANASNDQVVQGSQLVGGVVGVLPGAGEIGAILRNWWAVAFAVYLPLLSLIVYELIRLVRYYTRPTYQLLGRSGMRKEVDGRRIRANVEAIVKALSSRSWRLYLR